MPEYIEKINGYTYKVDTEKGHTTAYGDIQNETAERNPYLQAKIGKESGEQYYDGGHLIGTAENGSPDSINIHSQARDLNRGAYKSVENVERNLATEQDTEVYTEKTAFMIDGTRVPSTYIINDRVIRTDGTEDNIHMSFANLNKNEMQKIQNQMEQIDVDDEMAESSFDGQGLSKEEIEEVLVEGDKYLTVKEQFSDDWTTFKLDDEPMEESDGYDDIGEESDAGEFTDSSEGDIS